MSSGGSSSLSPPDRGSRAATRRCSSTTRCSVAVHHRRDPGGRGRQPDATDDDDDADDDGFVLLTGGGDDTVAAADLPGLLAGAFERFGTFDIQLLCCPESTNAAVVSGALTYCANRGDCMFLGSPTPAGSDQEAAKTYGKGFQGDKVYGAIYFPQIRVNDPLGTQRWVPPVGHVAGVSPAPSASVGSGRRLRATPPR